MRFILSFLFLSFSFLSAQTQITANDLLGLIGKSGLILEDTTESVTVDVGPSGENQNWDFSGLSLHGSMNVYSFLDPSGTPFTGQFPSANLVQKSYRQGDTTTVFYNYINVQSDYINNLGDAFTSTDTSYVGLSNETIDLPVGYGDSWTSVDTSSYSIAEVNFIYIDSTVTTVDGWGMVTVPAGTFECIRTRDMNFNISQYKSGDLAFSDTSTSISYEWITKDYFIVATIESQDGETNVNFTNAGFVSLLQELNTTAIPAVDNNLPRKMELLQNSPNPFNPSTVISYRLPVNSDVKLIVYDALGHMVRKLVDTRQAAGSYSITFDAQSLANGVYFYKLQAGNFAEVKRMLLIK